jgi:hypothetical protein
MTVTEVFVAMTRKGMETLRDELTDALARAPRTGLVGVSVSGQDAKGNKVWVQVNNDDVDDHPDRDPPLPEDFIEVEVQVEVG